MEATVKDPTNLPKKDILEIFKQGNGGIVMTSFNWPGALRFRACAFVAMVKGYFSVGEFFRILLPSSLSPGKLGLLQKYNDFLCHELETYFPSFPKNHVNLFGHPFGSMNYYEVFELVEDVIIKDQYHIQERLAKDSVVIDAGANIGTFSVFAAHLVPQGKVYSFEPVKGTYELLKANTAPYPQVTCVNAGLGSQVAQKKMLVDSKYTTRNVVEDSPFYSAISGSGEEKRFEIANILTIDQFVSENKIPRIDFIKADTEGYEVHVLNGARESIKKWKPVIGISAYHNEKDKQEIPQILKEIDQNYVCELCTNDREEDFICYVK